MTDRRRARRGSRSRSIAGAWIPWPGARITLARATNAELQAIEARWRPLRSASEMHWRWSRIASSADETIMVVRNGDAVVALWAGRSARPRREPTYFLDYLEVAPTERGRSLVGPTTMQLIAHHACSSGHVALALAALPDRVAWYVRSGARPDDRAVDDGLVALRFDLAILHALSRVIDAAREEAE